ncbi:unnamed protein product [Urochloa decumbens]|uniref:Sulfotransferase n=1 Tax=Urochloa decumbens TaxID=240449 RepID=A0ABC9HEN2_9POAL
MHPHEHRRGRHGETMVAGRADDGLSKYESQALSLPASRRGQGCFPYRKYGGFWYPEHLMAATLAMRDTFAARPSDVILATMPKSGSTWLKALVYAVVRRGRHLVPAAGPGRARGVHGDHPHELVPAAGPGRARGVHGDHPHELVPAAGPGRARGVHGDHPLLASSPHELVPFLHDLYNGGPLLRLEDEEGTPSPRVLAVHAAFTALPASVPESGCRVVYLCRDPKDAFVSLRHYLDDIKPKGSAMTPLAEAFDLFCDGVSPFGPVWDHMAGYWKESVARPEEVMFLRYEDLKEDAVGSVRRLAEFLGCPFTGEEVAGGVPEAVVALCSMDRMRSVQANRDGLHGTESWSFKNSAFFRKGEVGDWKAHLTPEMAQRLDAIVEDKLRGSGLSLLTVTRNGI